MRSFIAWLNPTIYLNSSIIFFTRYGSEGSTFKLRYTGPMGRLMTINIADEVNVQPVFYLATDVQKIGGTGNYDDPYLIK